MTKSPAFRLFLISFLTLYFELVCIRWLTSYVLYLGYFTNFVLLGALLGIGAGALIAGRKPGLIGWLPPVMFGFFSLILITRAQVRAGTEDFIYFTNNIAALPLPPYVLLPLIFIGVTAMFTLLSVELGVLITVYPPLKAYNINILGSLAGIVCFTLFSFLSFPAWLWFLIIAILLLPFLARVGNFGRNAILLAGLVAVIAASDFAYQAIWSPYSRLGLFERQGNQVLEVNANEAEPAGVEYTLAANGVWHQDFTTLERNEPFYWLPYTTFPEEAVDEVLVIGSGGGNDVSFALASGAGHVDAVEIDPAIPQLGRKFHPEKPYDDPRVTLYINDARAFLEKTDKQYDVIIFALPDSLVLATSSSNIRLESFLFTQESFEAVKEHLKPNGLFVLYNYYRYDWLVEKIAFMAEEVFGEAPVVHRFDDPISEVAEFATIFVGPRASKADTTQSGFSSIDPSPFRVATDNWPFLYLREPALPLFYSATLLIILAFSFLFIRRAAPTGAITRHGLPFFFMGAAFTLLEVKSIVHFFLLFGATWLVNSLVFFAILLVVLVANALAARYRFANAQLLYGLLFFMLALNFLIPLKTFLFDNLALRFITATLFLFSPVFFANLIYSTAFRDTERANIAYGANLLGTMVGGATEYLSLYFGYQNLAIVAAIFYFLAFYYFTRMHSGVRSALLQEFHQ